MNILCVVFLVRLDAPVTRAAVAQISLSVAMALVQAVLTIVTIEQWRTSRRR
jgi:hypothetical protein